MTIYTSAAKTGFKIAEKIRPRKVKRAIHFALGKLPKSVQTGFKKMQISENMAARTAYESIYGSAQHGYTGYRWLHGSTLGTPTRRKVTTGVISTAGILKLMDD